VGAEPVDAADATLRESDASRVGSTRALAEALVDARPLVVTLKIVETYSIVTATVDKGNAVPCRCGTWIAWLCLVRSGKRRLDCRSPPCGRRGTAAAGGRPTPSPDTAWRGRLRLAHLAGGDVFCDDGGACRWDQCQRALRVFEPRAANQGPGIPELWYCQPRTDTAFW